MRGFGLDLREVYLILPIRIILHTEVLLLLCAEILRRLMQRILSNVTAILFVSWIRGTVECGTSFIGNYFPYRNILDIRKVCSKNKYMLLRGSKYEAVLCTISPEVCSHLLTLVPRLRIILPWRWRRYFPPKRRFTKDLHGATSQKTAFFIVTAVKNLKSYLNKSVC
jgi:hypothetical protein